MNILVIESSPHKKGSSNLLAEHFMEGAKEAGHQVTVFDAARADLHPCLGCDACGMSGSCCQKDDMAGLREQILQTDMLVFVTPLYYFGMSTQLKTVIDRFYSFICQLYPLLGARHQRESDMLFQQVHLFHNGRWGYKKFFQIELAYLL